MEKIPAESRQKLTKKPGPGPGLGPSSRGRGRGRDFENEFAGAGAGEKTRIPAVSGAGAGIPVDHWEADNLILLQFANNYCLTLLDRTKLTNPLM